MASYRAGIGGSCMVKCLFFMIFSIFFFFFYFFIYFFVFLLFLWAAPAAYRGSQARGLIGAAAPGLHQSHSNVASEPRLQPTP